MSTIEMVDNLHDRLARYYLDRLRSVEVAYKHGHEQLDYALSIFDQEWPQIRQWRDWVVSLGPDGGTLAPLYIKFSEITEDIFGLRLSPRERLEWLETGLAAANELKDTQATAKHLYLMAAAYNDSGEFLKAAEYGMQALEQLGSVNDPMTKGRMLQLLGYSHLMLGDFLTATPYFNESLEVFRSLDALRQIGAAQAGLGLAAWRMGDAERAHRLLTECLALAREFGQEKDICDALIDLCLPTRVLFGNATVQEMLEECMVRCRRIGYYRVLALCHNSLGQIEINEGLTLEGLSHFEEAVSVSRNSGVPRDMTIFLTNASAALWDLGRYHEAMQYAEESLAFARASGQRLTLAYCFCAAAEIGLELGQIDEARQRYYEAIKIVSEIDSAQVKIDTLGSAPSIWHRLGCTEQAAEWIGLILDQPTVEDRERQRLERLCGDFEAELGPAVFAAAIERGRQLHIDDVIQQMLRELDEVAQPHQLA